MSIKTVRQTDVLDFIVNAGGETTATNAQIAAAIDSVNDEYSGSIRVSEILRDLEDTGDITIIRGRRHPKTNPSGRVIRAVTF